MRLMYNTVGYVLAFFIVLKISTHLLEIYILRNSWPKYLFSVKCEFQGFGYPEDGQTPHWPRSCSKVCVA